MTGPTPDDFQQQLRSLFAVLRTLVRETRDGRASVDDYAAHLEGRIATLARVHEILMRAPAEGADLYELLSGELISQAVAESRFHISGPEMRIAPDCAAPLALAFHELTVNAASYGALSSDAGCVEISWVPDGDAAQPWLCLDWLERGGQFPENPLRSGGFGKALLERVLPYEFGVRTQIRSSEAGIHVQLQIPAHRQNGRPVWRRPPA